MTGSSGGTAGWCSRGLVGWTGGAEGGESGGEDIRSIDVGEGDDGGVDFVFGESKKSVTVAEGERLGKGSDMRGRGMGLVGGCWAAGLTFGE